MGITDWFNEGTLVQQVFRLVAFAGLVMAVFQVILRILGLDDHFDVSDADTDHGHAISWTTVAGFALGFGAVGSILIANEYSLWIAALGGSATGLAVASGFFFLMRAFSGLKEDNTFDIRNSVGKVGTAYIRIPARQGGQGGSGSGQVQVVAQSRLVTLAAISEEEIASGEKVRVLEVIDHETVKVERAV